MNLRIRPRTNSANLTTCHLRSFTIQLGIGYCLATAVFIGGCSASRSSDLISKADQQLPADVLSLLERCPMPSYLRDRRASIEALETKDGIDSSEATGMYEAAMGCEFGSPGPYRASAAEDAWLFRLADCYGDCDSFECSGPELRIDKSGDRITYDGRELGSAHEVVQCALHGLSADAAQDQVECRQEAEVRNGRLRAVGLVRLEVERDITAGTYSAESHEVLCRNGKPAGKATLYSDRSGTARKYELAGTGEGALAVYYYDGAGTLRYAESTLTDDVQASARGAYYDDAGESFQNSMGTWDTYLDEVLDPRQHLESLADGTWIGRMRMRMRCRE